MLISDWSSDVCSSDLGPAFCIRTSSGQDAPFQDQRGDRTLEHEARRGGVYQFEDDLGKVVAAKGTPSLLAAGIGVPWTGEKGGPVEVQSRSEEQTSELQSLMRNSYAVFCLKKKIIKEHRKD